MYVGGKGQASRRVEGVKGWIRSRGEGAGRNLSFHRSRGVSVTWHDAHFPLQVKSTKPHVLDNVENRQLRLTSKTFSRNGR